MRFYAFQKRKLHACTARQLRSAGVRTWRYHVDGRRNATRGDISRIFQTAHQAVLFTQRSWIRDIFTLMLSRVNPTNHKHRKGQQLKVKIFSHTDRALREEYIPSIRKRATIFKLPACDDQALFVRP